MLVGIAMVGTVVPEMVVSVGEQTAPGLDLGLKSCLCKFGVVA